MTDARKAMESAREANRRQGMVRSIDQWRNMVPAAVAAGSVAQIEYALIDAKTDISALWFALAALDAALASGEQGWRIPEGYVLVPVEPTPEMLDAMLGPKSSSAYEDHCSMLAAAPPAPEPRS